MNKSMIIVLCVVLSLGFLSCCKPDPEPENGTKDPNGNTNPDNGNEEPVVLKWDNPWDTTNVGDSAVYKIDTGEETWQFVTENDTKTVVKTIPGDDMLGLPPSESKVALDEIMNSPEPKWWEQKREEGMDFSIEMTFGETKIACTKINIGNREYTVSKDLPFDGVVELEIDGKTVRKLIGFKRVEGVK